MSRVDVLPESTRALVECQLDKTGDRRGRSSRQRNSRSAFGRSWNSLPRAESPLNCSRTVWMLMFQRSRLPSAERNDRGCRRLFVPSDSERLERRPLLAAIVMQVVVPPHDAGLHVIQDLRDEILRHPCVRHQRRRGPAKIVRDELEAAALAKSLIGSSPTAGSRKPRSIPDTSVTRHRPLSGCAL
jgi:hypothetical protein